LVSGCAEAYCKIGYAYDFGHGVEIDKKKAIHYYKLAAIGGDVYSRYNLGAVEGEDGNMNRALKHYMIAAGGGIDLSLKEIHEWTCNKMIMQQLYELNQVHLVEIKSTQRDEAAAARANYRNY
jgi:TPR repeat protein